MRQEEGRREGIYSAMPPEPVAVSFRSEDLGDA